MSSKAAGHFVSGFLNPKGNLGDFQHAARTFVDDSFRLMPKHKFLFHVSFQINTNALKSLNFKYQHQNEINILVKSADLPKYTIATETLNQYNRKKVIQTKVDYQPITIKFHDDNLGVTRQLWENYFGYYYADSVTSKVSSTYTRNAMLNSSFHRAPYGLDNNSSIPFFDAITIYQMARRYWNSYTLVNPIITAWNHDNLDYTNNGPVDHSMTLAYEAVYHNNGFVQPNNPAGFAVDHYDSIPSPISLAGGGTRSIFGPGGTLAGIETVFGSVGSGKAFESPENFVTTVVQGINTYQNTKSLSSTGINQEFQSVSLRGLTAASRSNVRSNNETRFPITEYNQNNVTQALPRNLIR